MMNDLEKGGGNPCYTTPPPPNKKSTHSLSSVLSSLKNNKMNEIYTVVNLSQKRKVEWSKPVFGQDAIVAGGK